MKKLSLLLILSTLFIQLSFSLEVPKLNGRVNDYAGILSSSEESKLEGLIESMEDGTSSQVAILTVKSLEGDNLEDFSIRTVDQWKLGTSNNDNGVLILVAWAEKKIRIEVGYGLEHILTDAKSSYIIRNIIAPNFRSGDVYKGLLDASDTVIGLISGEYAITASQLKEDREEERSSSGTSGIGTFIFFILFFIFTSIGKRGVGRGRRGRGGNLGTFILLNSLLNSSRRSGGGFGGGSGFSSGGGFGGGGFSGGGGGFGGGGASGGW